MSEKPCQICGSNSEVITVRIPNGHLGHSGYICMKCHAEVQHLQKLMWFMESSGMAKLGMWGANKIPMPWKKQAENPHDWAGLVDQVDEQSSVGNFACLKCGGRWVVTDKHQALFLTQYDECPGFPLKES